jgi:deoxyadenosine/deoxycytidine kinase
LTRKIYIGFEGPIGAGKTTLAQLLANHLDAEAILENVDGNEFLADFYQKRERWALPMQLWFLADRHRQLSSLKSNDHRWFVADYTYAKDAIFARHLLHGRELSLYNHLSSALTATVKEPDLTVYLDANDDTLLERIKRRGRNYEQHIDETYLDSVRESYETYLAAEKALNVFRFNTSLLNLDDRMEMNELYERIVEAVERKNGK